MEVLMISVVLACLMALSFAAAWMVRGREVEDLKQGLKQATDAHAESLLRVTMSHGEASQRWSEERERLVRAILHMKRGGFEAPLDDPERPLDSWVMDEEYERKVDDARQHGGVSEEERDTYRDAILGGIRSKPLQ